MWAIRFFLAVLVAAPAMGDINATVGKDHKQDFRIMFDSGSSKPWFQATGSSGYNGHGTPLHKNDSIKYLGSASNIEGPLYQDDVAFNGYVAKDLQIIAAHPSPGASPISYSIIGMSYSPKPHKGVAGFFESLILQKVVSVTEWSIFTSRNNAPEETHVKLGGRNSTHYTGSFVTVPLVQQGSWPIKLDGYSVNGKYLNKSSHDADVHVDTGTWLILVPEAVAAAIHATIPAAVPIPDQLMRYAYPCNTSEKHMPTFVFSGVPFSIATQDFDGGWAKEKGMCQSTISGVRGDRWIFGWPFLRSFYTVFSWGEPAQGSKVGKGAAVHFAKAVHKPQRKQVQRG